MSAKPDKDPAGPVIPDPPNDGFPLEKDVSIPPPGSDQDDAKEDKKHT